VIKARSEYSRLIRWYGRQKRVLPWRDDPSLYKVWISEIMLQQTQVTTVLPYFQGFMKRFPSLKALAAATEEAVLENWAGLGYYRRARNLHRAAKIMKKKGPMPTTFAAWLELPGVGRYTAAAIVSISLNQPEAILDGNCERVISRMRRVRRNLNFKQRLWSLAEAYVRAGHNFGYPPQDLNQALMELGAVVCLPRSPHCGQCPMQSSCMSFQQGDTEAFPEKKTLKKWVKVSEQMHCLINSKNEVWLKKSALKEWRGGMWDLPKVLPCKGKSQLKKIAEVRTSHRLQQATIAFV